jgi:hypothetical protein
LAPSTTDLIIENGPCKDVDGPNLTDLDEKTRYK